MPHFATCKVLRYNRYMKRTGFTLIELLIVVTIIGILAVALVPRIIGGSVSARDARRQVDIQAIANGIEYYLGENVNFDDITDADNVLCSDELSPDLSPVIGSMPSDPQDDHANNNCTGTYEIRFLTGDGGSLNKYAIVTELEAPQESSETLYKCIDENPDYPSFANEMIAGCFYISGDDHGYAVIY